MEIVDKRDGKLVYLSTLPGGACFCWNNILYMKVWGDDHFNAVVIETGELHTIATQRLVQPVDIKAVLE